MVATVIDEPDGFLQPVIGIPTQFLQQWSRVKQQVFMKAMVILATLGQHS